MRARALGSVSARGVNTCRILLLFPRGYLSRFVTKGFQVRVQTRHGLGQNEPRDAVCMIDEHVQELIDQTGPRARARPGRRPPRSKCIAHREAPRTSCRPSRSHRRIRGRRCRRPRALARRSPDARRARRRRRGAPARRRPRPRATARRRRRRRRRPRRRRRARCDTRTSAGTAGSRRCASRTCASCAILGSSAT